MSSRSVTAIHPANQRHAGSLVLDQQGIVVAGMAPTAVQLDDLTLECRIFQALANHIQHVGGLTSDEEHNTG